MSLAAHFGLGGKVALVTGARRGLGRAIAVALAEAGADVVGLGPNPMPETADAVAATGRSFAEIRLDLAESAEIDAAVSEAHDRFGRLDILVNNAGIIRRADLLDYEEADWDAVMDVNVRSLFLLSQAAARLMIAARMPGRIINVGSLLSFQGGIRVPAYTASKHAVAGLTKALANELAPHAITVNAIAPGYMVTDNTAPLRDDPERSAQLMARIPAGRFGSPEEIATAVLFLAAPGSSYVTGAVVSVDGGWMAR
ncbi:MAG: 2-dehydro-3-deoxy-D-gluconate 5-dehydrogenase KduD [Rhizobiales bacterium]|nr:2-dehydro-3-deoxy-D-gluconate 5-dehydrogenase KduD [Hyphomicrobiales bacterium]